MFFAAEEAAATFQRFAAGNVTPQCAQATIDSLGGGAEVLLRLRAKPLTRK